MFMMTTINKSMEIIRPKPRRIGTVAETTTASSSSSTSAAVSASVVTSPNSEPKLVPNSCSVEDFLATCKNNNNNNDSGRNLSSSSNNNSGHSNNNSNNEHLEGHSGAVLQRPHTPLTPLLREIGGSAPSLSNLKSYFNPSGRHQSESPNQSGRRSEQGPLSTSSSYQAVTQCSSRGSPTAKLSVSPYRLSPAARSGDSVGHHPLPTSSQCLSPVPQSTTTSASGHFNPKPPRVNHVANRSHNNSSNNSRHRSTSADVFSGSSSSQMTNLKSTSSVSSSSFLQSSGSPVVESGQLRSSSSAHQFGFLGAPAALRISPVIPQSARSTPVIHQSSTRSTPVIHYSARSTPIVQHTARSTPVVPCYQTTASSSPLFPKMFGMGPTETGECGSLSKSSSDGYDVVTKKKVLSKLKSRKRGQTPVFQQLSEMHYYHSPTILLEQIKARPTSGGHSISKQQQQQQQQLSQVGYEHGVSSSDDQRSSGHATMSDPHSSYVSSSATDEDSLRVILEEGSRQFNNVSHLNQKLCSSSGGVTGIKLSGSKRGLHGRRRAGDHHLRRVHANDNLLATIIAEEGQGISDVQQIMHAMEQLKLRGPSNGYSTSTSTYSTVSGTSLDSESVGIQRLIRHSSLETIATNVTTADEFVWLDSHSRLVELQHLPWSNQEVLQVLQRGRLKSFVDRISMEAVLRLSYLLQRPLVRIAREAQRFSRVFGMCSKNEIISSLKVILSPSLADTCIKSGHRTAAIYAVNGENYKQSKSTQAGLQLSIGKFHRWMCDVNLGTFVHDYAAIYLTAGLENLLEEIVLLCLSHCTETIVTIQVLEGCIANSPDLWGLLQPYAHLNAGRTSSGALGLPSLQTELIANASSISQPSVVPQHQSFLQMPNDEKSLLTTCVGSIKELGDAVSRIVQYRNEVQGSNCPGCGPVSGGSSHCNSVSLISDHLNSGSAQNVRNHNCSNSCTVWEQGALSALYYFMRCAQMEHNENGDLAATRSTSQELVYERPYLILPPLTEWIKVASAHAEHRRSCIVDRDDVMQAARLLLPGVDCPYRQISYFTDDWLYTKKEYSKNDCSKKIKTDLAFRMLLSGRTDLVPCALSLLPPATGVNTMNEAGLTPLMLSAIQDDEAMVQMLINAGADIDGETLPAPTKACPYVCPDIQYWTALTFATIHQRLSIVRLLLEKGANVEGGARLNEERSTETPLQLAAASGNIELVKILLSYGAHPFLSTISNESMSMPVKGCPSAIAVAAGHGQRLILRTLLAHPLATVNKDVLSLEEILAEGQATIRSINRIKVVPMNQANVSCMTTVAEDGNKVIHLTKHQLKALQEAIYHSVENGHLEITLDLRNFGVPWTLHCWMQTLSTAHEMRLDAITDQLLQDFLHLCPDDCSAQFIDDCLPLLFTIFRHSKNEGTSLLLADIFSTCYGKEKIKPIAYVSHGGSCGGGTRIDLKYVNNPEMSDVMFEVEGKLIYAHKIILVNASDKFRLMLATNSKSVPDLSSSSTSPSTTSATSKQQLASPPVYQISDIRYDIFLLIMKFLYNGGFDDNEVDQKDIFELLAGANYYQLDGLLNYCEYRLTTILDLDNVVSIYIHANVYSAIRLQEFCQGFILQNLVGLLTYDESVRKLIFAKSLRDHDVLSGLLFTLQNRVRERSTRNNVLFSGQPKNKQYLAQRKNQQIF